MIYESANVWGKVFSFQWNWHCLCCWFYCSSSHCLGLSVISMQASPPATQRGKFNSNTYLPVLENPKLHAADRLSTGAGGSAPCGNYSGKSCFATPSSSFSSPWSTGSLSICHIQYLHWYIYCTYRTHNSYIWHTDDLMKPLNREKILPGNRDGKIGQTERHLFWQVHPHQPPADGV